MVGGRFLGRYEHSLDTKGRVILPVRFREPFEEEGGVLTANTEGCVALWTPAEFERQANAIQEEALLDQEHRNRARVWFADAFEVVVDKQGRMPVPAILREKAQLESDVSVIGVKDRIEFWNPEVWTQNMATAEAYYRQGTN